MAKPDFMVMVPDLYRRRRRRQARRRLPPHRHEPQTLTYIDILYTKMILWPSQTSWRWSLTSTADVAGARDAEVFLATLLSLRDTCNSRPNKMH